MGELLFCAWVRILGTNFGAFLFIWRSFFRIVWALPLEILTWAATCLIVARLSWLTTSCTACTVAKFLAVGFLLGCSLSHPDLSPWSALTYQRLQVDLDKLSFPYTSWRSLKVSPCDFPLDAHAIMWCRCVQQSFMLLCVSRADRQISDRGNIGAHITGPCRCLT